MHRLQLSTAGECVSSSLHPVFHEYIFSALPTCALPPVESMTGAGFRVPLCFVLMLRESVASRTERAPIAGRMAESMDEKGVRALFSKLGWRPQGPTEFSPGERTRMSPRQPHTHHRFP